MLSIQRENQAIQVECILDAVYGYFFCNYKDLSELSLDLSELSLDLS